MYKFKSKNFRCQTRDYLLDNITKFPAWMNALMTWNDCSEEKLTPVLKGKFKALLMKGGQDNKYSVVNREIIFSKIENLGSILEKIGEAFLCNIEMNSTPTYLNLENMVCLNLDITESYITAMSLQATVSALIKGENMYISCDDLALSSDEEEESVTPPKSLLKCSTETESTENSSYFSPNSDDELAKYLNSEMVSNTNIKKEKKRRPRVFTPKNYQERKKGKQQSQKETRWA